MKLGWRTAVSSLWLAIIAVWAAFGPRAEMDLAHLLEAPTFRGFDWLGRDAFGRTLQSALSEAMARSLTFALISTFAAVSAGLVFGAFLGGASGRARFFGERVLDFFLAFPPMLLALVVQALIGTGWRSLGFAVTIGLVPGVVRFISSRAKEIAVTDYLGAAIALGGTSPDRFRRHYLPDLLEYLRLKFPSLFAQALLLEGTLSFLNLGVPPGVISWGSLLLQGKDYLIEAPHIAWSVGIPLVVTLLALQTWVDDATQVRRAARAL